MRRSLLLALMGSVLLHVVALFMPEFDLMLTPERPPLRVELPPVAQPKPQPPAAARAPASPKKTPAPLPLAPEAPASVAAETPAVPAISEPPAPESTRVAAQPEQAEPSPPEPPSLTQPLNPELPAHGGLHFLVYYGEQDMQVGEAEHRWMFIDGVYQISSVMKTTGLAGFFKPYTVEINSRGRMGPVGLQPEYYEKIDRKKASTESITFDWEKQEARLGDGRVFRVAKGAQDLLSMHYQLALLRDLTKGVRMGVASGRNYGEYPFETLGEEKTDLPAGSFRTLHVRVKTESTVQFWLALDHQMLPVKIRYADRKGEVFELRLAESGMKKE